MGFAMSAREIDDEVAREVKRRLRAGARGCDYCDNTGWRSKEVNPYMLGWELCGCWIGDLWHDRQAEHLQKSEQG